jgi:phosphatidylserine/phosphatidylglycerophosphate/cardiolipin synthase-like enzyme
MVRGPFLPSGPEGPFPVREGNCVRGLLLAEEMYPELERRTLAATRSVELAFRIFDPDTRTRSEEARALGLADWTAVLRHAVERGVTVRLLLTDFEPTVAHDLHGGSWSTFRTLRAMADALPRAAWERFEIIVSQHPGEMGWALRQLLRLPVGLFTRRLLRRFEQDGGDLDALIGARPGLWRYHRVDGDRLRFRRGPAFRLWPATHHHKFALFDGEAAILGGIDVDERRWETRRYRQPANASWHDVSVLVEGPAVADACAHFRTLWNAELPRYREVTRFWMTDAERELAIDPLDEMPEDDRVPGPAGEARAQMLRTQSRRHGQPFAVGPKADVRELMEAHRRLIAQAERLLYIEAQFFRDQRVSAWIGDTARHNPGLEVVVVLPQAPEEVAFDDQGDNPAHRHGEWRQARALWLLKASLGARAGLFSLARQAPLTDEERALVATRGAAFGAGMIYVHSKLLIADDRFALCSSANINRRSFHWDSEFGMLWEDGEGVAALRKRIWTRLMGTETLPGPGEAVAAWRRLAADNLDRTPEERQGFIVPYRLARARRFGRPAWFVPDDLV